MKKTDEAMRVSDINARMLAAVYFGLLAILATILVDTFLYLIGVQQIIPIFQSVLLATVLAALFGALFAHKIMHCPKPYKLKAFWWGFLMVIVAIPFYNIGLLYFMMQEHGTTFQNTSFMQIVYLYLFSLAYVFILAGLWLAVLAGFAAMYLRTRLVYDVLHSQNQDRKLPVEKKTKMHRSINPNRTKPS